MVVPSRGCLVGLEHGSAVGVNPNCGSTIRALPVGLECGSAACVGLNCGSATRAPLVGLGHGSPSHISLWVQNVAVLGPQAHFILNEYIWIY